MFPGTQLSAGVRPTVLVLDTDAKVGLALYERLVSAGFHGCIVSSREDAIEILQCIRFEVIVACLELGELVFQLEAFSLRSRPI